MDAFAMPSLQSIEDLVAWVWVKMCNHCGFPRHSKLSLIAWKSGWSFFFFFQGYAINALECWPCRCQWMNFRIFVTCETLGAPWISSSFHDFHWIKIISSMECCELKFLYWAKNSIIFMLIIDDSSWQKIVCHWQQNRNAPHWLGKMHAVDSR